MLEAVNSVLQTAPLARGSAEQNSNARSFAANPEKIQEAPRAPYISPFIYVDVNYDKAVLQIRDSETGDVITQFPSESRLRAALAQEAQSEAPRVDTSSFPAPSSVDRSFEPAPQQQTASAPEPQQQAASQPAPQAAAGNAVTAQQIAAFKSAAASSSAGNGGNVSLFA